MGLNEQQNTRLAIIEVENLFNRNKSKSCSKGTTNQNRSDKENNAGKERRLAFHTISEILTMKNDGAQLLHNLDLSLIQSFTPLAGQGYADLWIRKETHESLHEYDDMIKGQVKRSRIVFLTCDLMNALSAVAE